MKAKTKKVVVDKVLRKQLGYKGGVQFNMRDCNFIRKGDGYEAIIHVYDYPMYPFFGYMNRIFSIPDVVVVRSSHLINQKKSKKMVSDSIAEMRSRKYRDQRGSALQENTDQEMDLNILTQKIEREGEIIKAHLMNIICYAKTIPLLEKKVEEVLDELVVAGFEGTIRLNENELQHKAVMGNVKDNRTSEIGKLIPSEALSLSFPYTFTQYIDEGGYFLGETFAGGLVVMNHFKINDYIRSFDTVRIGKKGSGKSTAIKMDMEHNFRVGNKIIGFDAERELGQLVHEMGGLYINVLDGKFHINLLEVPRYEIPLDDFDVSTTEINGLRNSYSSVMQVHFSKLKTFFKYLLPETKSSTIDGIVNEINSVYTERGINERTLDNFTSNDFPIFSDVLKSVDHKINVITENEQYANSLDIRYQLDRLFEIRTALADLVEGTNSTLFNVKSNYSLANDVIIYDVQEVLNLDQNIKAAYLFLLLDIIWNKVAQNKIENTKKGTLSEKINGNKIAVYLDESPEYINTRNPLGLEYISQWIRRFRKYLAGLNFAAQSIGNFTPSGDSEAVGMIKTIFGLVEYTYLFQQDKTVFSENDYGVSEIQKMLPNVTRQDLVVMGTFKKGDCLLITPQEKTYLHVVLTESRRVRYAGGVG